VIPTVDPVRALEAALRDVADFDIEKHTFHHFCNGMYARELALPAGTVAVGKLHKEQNFFVVLKGELLLATPDGPLHITAPFMCTTEPGTKRAVYALTDCLVMNFHPNHDNERDMARLESRYITPEALPAPDKEQIECHG
jgi:hypothetical protein